LVVSCDKKKIKPRKKGALCAVGEESSGRARDTYPGAEMQSKAAGTVIRRRMTGLNWTMMVLPVLVVLMQFALDTVRCEFQFTVTPESRQVFEGEPVTFECRAMFDDEIDFSWTRNGIPVPAKHERLSFATPQRIYQSGSNLHIRAVNGTLDRGDYVCLATARASGARVASPAATLDVIAYKA
uniref:Ig-like domain-containing protein n=1 Tax=Anopheles coluzzii TaxID=1518534 RepID=A0A8W7Q272_ANOCL